MPFHATRGAYQSYVNNSIEKAITRGLFTQRDADLLYTFIQEKEATDDIQDIRAFKIATTIVSAKKYLPVQFSDCNIQDLYKAISEIKKADYKQNTKSDFVRFLKRFLLWLIEKGENTMLIEKEVMKIRAPRNDNMTKTAEMMLEESEVMNIISHCNNSRDRALVSMLYEGGFRIGELGGMKWGQVDFPPDKDWSAIINVADKTGKPRAVPLIMAKPYLIKWKEDYPGGSYTREDYVFVSSKKNPLQYRAVHKMISIASKRAGIDKHITPHIFRHSRITHLVKDGVGEAIIKEICWGNQSTDMMRTYSHITPDHILDAIASKYGFVPSENKKIDKSHFEPVMCPRCKTINGPTIKYCGECGNPLHEDIIQEYEELERLILTNPSALMKIAKMLEEKKKI